MFWVLNKPISSNGVKTHFGNQKILPKKETHPQLQGSLSSLGSANVDASEILLTTWDV